MGRQKWVCGAVLVVVVVVVVAAGGERAMDCEERNRFVGGNRWMDGWMDGR